MSTHCKFSPYKRSYQFIHLQNQAYHLRNKAKAKPLVNTNIQWKRKTNTSQQETRSQHNQVISSDRYSRSGDTSPKNTSDAMRQSFSFRQPHRVIHKHEVFERAKSANINRENLKIVSKLIETDCMIVSRSQARQNFQRHKKYGSMIRRYQENGQPHTTPIINLKHLNPALASYRSSRISTARRRQHSQQNLEPFRLNWLE